jgi:hypothetical protein
MAARLWREPGGARGVDSQCHGRSTRYLDLMLEMKNAYSHRLRIVESARQHCIKPTAGLFTTTVPAVRKWLRRYQHQGPSGLIERSRAPVPAENAIRRECL